MGYQLFCDSELYIQHCAFFHIFIWFRLGNSFCSIGSSPFVSRSFSLSADGTLLITSTGINDKAIYRYRFNLHKDISSSARFTKLATTYKNHATFSGTEVCLCLSSEADVDDFILWLVDFVRKLRVLRAAAVLDQEMFVCHKILMMSIFPLPYQVLSGWFLALKITHSHMGTLVISVTHTI